MKISTLLKVGCLVIAFGFFLTCSANGQNTNGTDQTGKKMTDPKDKVNKPPRGIKGVDSDVDGQSSPTNFPPWIRVPFSTLGDNLIWIFAVDAGAADLVGGSGGITPAGDGTRAPGIRSTGGTKPGEVNKPGDTQGNRNPKPVVPPQGSGEPKIHHVPGSGGGVIVDGRYYFSALPPCETDMIVKSSLTTAAIAVAGKVLLKAMPKILAAYFGTAAASVSGALGVFIVPVDMEKIMYPGMQRGKKMTACLMDTKRSDHDVIVNRLEEGDGCFEAVDKSGTGYIICCDKLEEGLFCSIEGSPLNG